MIKKQLTGIFYIVIFISMINYGSTKNIEINADSFELDANKNIVEAIKCKFYKKT